MIIFIIRFPTFLLFNVFRMKFYIGPLYFANCQLMLHVFFIFLCLIHMLAVPLFINFCFVYRYIHKGISMLISDQISEMVLHQPLQL